MAEQRWRNTAGQIKDMAARPPSNGFPSAFRLALTPRSFAFVAPMTKAVSAVPARAISVDPFWKHRPVCPAQGRAGSGKVGDEAHFIADCGGGSGRLIRKTVAP